MSDADEPEEIDAQEEIDIEADPFKPASSIPRADPHPFGDSALQPPKSGKILSDDESESDGASDDFEDGELKSNIQSRSDSQSGTSTLDGPQGVLASGCPSIDELLDGGIEKDAISLVFGEAGSGKTNLALQLARNAARSGKRVAYVDTEGVSATRLAQIFGDDEASKDAQDRLLFFTPFTIQQQERFVRNATLAPDLGLVVVDSINMHYRLHMDGSDEFQREANRSIVQQLHHLTTFARTHHVPVLITGQVYGTDEGTHPFARRTMEHLVKALVRFHKTPDGGRKATVLKHRSIPDGRQARFRIVQEGLVASDKP
jgi:DNA repair protein RadB